MKKAIKKTLLVIGGVFTLLVSCMLFRGMIFLLAFGQAGDALILLITLVIVASVQAYLWYCLGKSTFHGKPSSILD